MEITATDKRRKLTLLDRQEIKRRYESRHITNETCESIARAFGIERHYVSIVAKSLSEIKEAPTT